MHVEAWAGFLQKQGLRVSQVLDIVPGCAVLVACPSCPDYSPEPPGQGRIIKNMLGWSQLGKTVRSGVWLFRGAPSRGEYFSSLDAVGEWVKKGSYHTAWSVPRDSSCTCSCAYGHGPAIGPHTLESGAGHCSPVCGGLSHL